MVDYDKSTGTSGKLRIRDLGYQIQFWLYCSDPQTYVGSLSYTITVNGQTITKTTSWDSGQGEAHLASYDVGTNQTVEFSIAATGTQGLGGPTSISQFIERSYVPDAPHSLRLRENTLNHFAFGVDYTAGGANGAAIDGFKVRWVRQQDGVLVWEDNNSQGYTNPGGQVTLTPGMAYEVSVQAHNSQGWGPWSAKLTARTLPGVWVFDESSNQFRIAVPYVWVDGIWRACVAYVWADDAWRETVR